MNELGPPLLLSSGFVAFLILLFLAVLVPFLASVIIYNGLVAKRNMVRNTFSSIDVNLKRRRDLIPNLVETVKAYAKHEKEVFTKAIELRNSLKGTSDQSQRMQLEREVRPVMNKLFALAEAYPELESHENFLNLQRNLTEVEEQISASRRAYNAAVMAQNNAVESFPSNLIAKAFSFQPHEFFEIPESERFSPKVDF